MLECRRGKNFQLSTKTGRDGNVAAHFYAVTHDFSAVKFHSEFIFCL